MPTSPSLVNLTPVSANQVPSKQKFEPAERIMKQQKQGPDGEIHFYYENLELREPAAGWIHVVSFLFSRQRLLCNKKVATSRPLAFVSAQPHRLLWALKSHMSERGGGS